MTNYEAIGRKTALEAERRAKHHEVQALGREISRQAVDYRLTAGVPPLSRRVEETQSLLSRVAVLAREIDDLDDQLRYLPA